MHWELGGDSSDHFAMAEVAAVTGAYVNAGEKAEADSFGAAWLNDKDLEELKEVAADKGALKALIFPGIVGAWADEDTAKGQAGQVEGRTQVIYKFKGKVLKPAGDKLHVFCRQFAKVVSLEQADGQAYHVCTLEDYAEHAKATTAEYAEHVKALAAAATAVAADAKEATDAAKGEGEKGEGNPEEDMNKADGDGTM